MKPVTVLTIAYAAGILLGRGFLYFPYSIAALLCFSLVAAVTATALRKIPVRRTLLVVVPAVAGFSACLSAALWLPADHYTRLFPDEHAVHQITGRIVSAIERDPDRTGFVLDISDIDRMRVSGRLRVSIRESTNGAGYGDIIRVPGRLFEPRGFRNPKGFDYSAYLAQSGIYRVVSIRAADQVAVLEQGRGVFRTIQNWREQIRQQFLVSTSGEGSAILQAMVLGEEGALSDDLRDRFLAAGVTHIISISGSHLGMVAIVCFGLIRLFMRLLPERTYLGLTLHLDPKKLAGAITLPLVVFYTLLSGGQMATIRSLIMITAALSALLLDRDNALLHSLAVAAFFILVISPQALFDISFQLSFLSVFTIAAVVLLWKELPIHPKTRLQKMTADTALLVVISFAASIATGPVVVHYFSQFSLAGLISNMIVVPLAGLIVVPLGLLSGILSLFLHYLPFASLNQLLADWFVRTVGFFSRLPFAELHPPAPGVFWLLAYAVLMVFLFRLVRARLLFALKPFEHSVRAAAVSARAAACLAFLFLAGHIVPPFIPSHDAILVFPDVGQGDCAVLQLPGGRNILIDGGGTADERFDTGRRVLAPFLWNRGIRKFDVVVLSHPHPDHMNGLKFILEKFDTKEVWTHGKDAGLPGYDEFLETASSRNIPRRVLSAEDAVTHKIGAAEIEILHPEASFRSLEKKPYAAENDDSLVLRIAVNGRVLLFTGDIGTRVEKSLLDHAMNVQCDLLKVPHHGSRSSSSAEFVSAASPSVAIVTAGRKNSYHHPSPEVIDRLEGIKAKIYRTDRDGMVSIGFDRTAFRVSVWDELELKPAVFFGTEGLKQEQENWKRAWTRKWEI